MNTWSGFVYVVFILDVFAQRIVGWHASTSKKVDLVMTPLRIAMWQRERDGHPVSPGSLIHHSDAGFQYTAIHLTEHLALEGIAASIGTAGDAYDNALMETVNGLFKTECIRTTVFHAGPIARSPTSSTRPQAGSTGTTTGASTGRWKCSPR